MRKKEILIAGGLSLFSLGIYLLSSVWVYSLGFPLDDAWIHQTYARNFAHHFQWSFFPGEVSGGSTGPLWGFLISVFYFLDLAPYVGTYFLGFLLMWGISILGMWVFSTLLPDEENKALYVGILLVFEWHLVWAAGSGMETLLFSLLTLVICGLSVQNDQRWFLLGLLVGVSVWVRPGGVTLLGPVFFVLLTETSLEEAWRGGIRVLFGFGISTGLYLLFNLWVAGDVLPNTFYAKQAEYAAARSAPLLRRAAKLGLQPFVGAGIVTLPGFVWYLIGSIKDKKWGPMAGPLWAVGYICLYVLRLPVTYQHGRYLIPTIPIFIVWGMAGLIDRIRWASKDKFRRIASKTWAGVLLAVTIIFWGVGARVYGRDVAFIETEMVKIAQWVDGHVEEGAVIAAHDIGALGYYADRKIVDMAGLVSPDVIPFIRDESRIANYLDENEVNYLITFPFWYPELTAQGELIYKTQSEFAPQMGMENMAVYRWKDEK